MRKRLKKLQGFSVNRISSNIHWEDSKMKTLSKENKTTIGYIIMGFCLLIFCTLAITAVTLRGDPYDTETLCTDNVQAHTIVVLDKTDSLSSSQQRFISKYINKEKDSLQTSVKFSVFLLHENSHVSPEPIFSKCNPGTGRDANQLYQNPRKIQMKFDEYFSKPLKRDMENILSDNSGTQSPILEMIRELTLRDDFGDKVQKRTLVIISDMMHHMSKYSHYKNNLDYDNFYNKPYSYEVMIRLDAVDVKVVYLLRKKLGNIQGERHLAFWQEYFRDSGTHVLEIRKVL
jgi:hypothetical protein